MSLVLDLPLHGSRLIEASAGTGKTFTIALLYVRLVLGHGNRGDASHERDNGFTRPLLPPEILVVTFTEAATQELRLRIRSRLVEAAEAFRAAPETAQEGDSRDPLLALRAEYSPEIWPACARRLQVAAEWMDDAAVSTIHAWTYQMLREHAFDSGNLFHQQLVTDLSELERDAAQDYWRRRFYPLDPARARLIAQTFPDPGALLNALRPLLKRSDAELRLHGKVLPPSLDLDAELAQAAASDAQAAQAEATARDSYRRHRDEVRTLLGELRPRMNANSYRGIRDDAQFEHYLNELDQWAEGGGAATAFITRLGSTRMKLNRGATPPVHSFFKEVDDWQDSLDEAADTSRLRAALLADAREWVARRLHEQLIERAEMGFDDLLERLDAALRGPQGETLAARIRAQFPVAMIDEFQDTDPLQYRIFDQIYRIAENAEDRAIILIGDPKQAIYAFRGADIHTYLAARHATAGRHYSLDTNYRSASPMVAAVNHWFEKAEQHERGAFRFRRGADNPLPFHSVVGQGRNETLYLDDSPAAGLTAWIPDEADIIGTTAYRALMAEHAAERIANWLNQAAEGRAGFREGDAFTPLRPRDIAVLVRNRTEADAVRAALHRRGLASVYLSDRESVFATPEAVDLLAWLRACAEPGDDSRVRAALASPTLSRTVAELDRLRQDELVWERYQQRFYDYRARWRRQGPLPMLRRLIHDFDLPSRLLASAAGERRMTNLLHLSEWTQQTAATLDGQQALIRQLAEHVANPPREEQVLRLESDAELIQVVTIHKSKGLEYPVVVLPFLCSWQDRSSKASYALYHDEGLKVEVGSPRDAAESYDLADDERLSEDVRLLYVALTRARHATFGGVAPIAPGRRKQADLHKSAVGYLLDGGQSIPDRTTLQAHLDVLVEGCPSIRCEAIESAVAHTPYSAPEGQGDLRPAREPSHAAFEPWWVSSYSALDVGGVPVLEEAPETSLDAVRDEARHETEPLPAPHTATPVPDTIHAFPRGPEPGTFLHGILEWAGEHGFANAVTDATARSALIERRCRARAWSEHTAVLDHWLETLLTQPLPVGPQTPLTLSEVERYHVETEFWFSVRRAHTTELDRLIVAHIEPGTARPALGYRQLNGLLKGFIDLVLEHEGRYYLIDWKSNYLGPNEAFYTADSMTRALLDQRYDVQASLYLLALHRYLSRRLPDYDYDRHVGGALFVFLRGILGPERGVLTVKPPKAFIEELDARIASAVEEIV